MTRGNASKTDLHRRNSRLCAQSRHDIWIIFIVTYGVLIMLLIAKNKNGKTLCKKYNVLNEVYI